MGSTLRSSAVSIPSTRRTTANQHGGVTDPGRRSQAWCKIMIGHLGDASSSSSSRSSSSMNACSNGRPAIAFHTESQQRQCRLFQAPCNYFQHQGAPDLHKPAVPPSNIAAASLAELLRPFLGCVPGVPVSHRWLGFPGILAVCRTVEQARNDAGRLTGRDRKSVV